MPYGTIIFIALILAVAVASSVGCRRYWRTRSRKRDGKAFKKPPISNWK